MNTQLLVKRIGAARIVFVIAAAAALAITLPVPTGAPVGRNAALALVCALTAMSGAILIEVWQWWRRSKRGALAKVALTAWSVVGVVVVVVIATVATRLLLAR